MLDTGNDFDINSVLRRVSDEEKKIADVLEKARKRVSEIEKELSAELVLRREKYEQELKSFRNELVLSARKQGESSISEVIKRAEQEAKVLSSKTITPAQTESIARSLFD